MVMIPKYSATGFVVRLKPDFGEIQTPMTNTGYYTPYQFGYKGQAVVLAKSSQFDPDATPTMLVAVPAGEGANPDGYIAVPDHTNDPRPGAVGHLLPEAGFLDQVDDQGIPYASKMANWATAGIVAFREGDIVGLPLAKNQTVEPGDELTVATGGLYRKVVSGDSGVWVVAKVEMAAKSTATTIVPVMSRIVSKRRV